jgi:hypothetical protein
MDLTDIAYVGVDSINWAQNRVWRDAFVRRMLNLIVKWKWKEFSDQLNNYELLCTIELVTL